MTKTHEEIIHSKDFLDNVLNTIGDGIYVLNSDGYVIQANRTLCDMTGYSMQELIGKYGSDLLPDTFSPEQVECSYDLLFYDTSQGRFEHTWQRRDGSLFPVEVRVTLLLDKAGEMIGMVGCVRDMTERRKLEERLRHTQKMDTVGTLAGGLAHNFNNILTAIIGFTETALVESQEGAPVAESLEQVLSASERAKHLVDQILLFSKQAGDAVAQLHLGKLAEDALSIFSSTLPENISIKTAFVFKCDRINGDQMQLEHVLLNLCLNAVQAIPETGGIIEVGLENTTLNPEEAVRLSEHLHAGQYVRLTVKDTGSGIAPEIRHRIFEPFFTTKGLALHSGLGLSVAEGIIKGHGGIINVESSPGEGSLFTILLPLISRKPDS